MGGALLKGWLDQGIASSDAVTVVEPVADAREALSPLGVDTVADADAALMGDQAPDLVLLAVKPQVMDEVAGAYRGLAGGGTVFLSIAAGKTTADLDAVLGPGAAIVRAMPNTPAQVGRGITALFATATVDEAGRALADRLMGAVGEVIWLDDENLMDGVTAVSGSGPAYVFHLIECLAAAGEKTGLNAEMAERLARATVTGAAELARVSPETAATLRQQVTSPGGTTAAALDVLMAEGGLEDLMSRAVAAAAKRSKDLSA
jgi:pyrroline-5-carboxylate reductase